MLLCVVALLLPPEDNNLSIKDHREVSDDFSLISVFSSQTDDFSIYIYIYLSVLISHTSLCKWVFTKEMITVKRSSLLQN